MKTRFYRLLAITSLATGVVALAPADAGADEPYTGVCGVGADDSDGDGVPAAADCDDADPFVGALIYESGFETDDSYFGPTPELPGPWTIGAGFAAIEHGGQQVLLGEDFDLRNTVTYVTLSGNGAETTCTGRACSDVARWRGGIVARASLDPLQDEGYNGLRCALANNDQRLCADPGSFVQLARFESSDDAAEDDLSYECDDAVCVNPTFTELDRVDHDIYDLDLAEGGSGRLTFFLYEDYLSCTAEDSYGNTVTATGTDDRLVAGAGGLSTLNLLGSFDSIKICETLGARGYEPEVDDDGDGVPAEADCDDTDPLLGALLYETDFSSDDGFLSPTAQKPGPWTIGGGTATTDTGGQNVLLGANNTWYNTVTFATLAGGRGASATCGSSGCKEVDRFRGGILARAQLDPYQDEGFHGYRCALAENSGDCHNPGMFLQTATFLPWCVAEEDNLASECLLLEGEIGYCPPNPTFDQLDRVDHGYADLDLPDADGSAQLTFWVFEQDLYCRAADEHGNAVASRVTDDLLNAGGATGLSTLNLRADFSYLKVCQVFGPAPAGGPSGGTGGSGGGGEPVEACDPAPWTVETVTPAFLTSPLSSAIDPQGELHAAYVGVGTGGTGLTHIQRDPQGTWTAEPVPRLHSCHSNPQIAFDPQGGMHIVYASKDQYCSGGFVDAAYKPAGGSFDVAGVDPQGSAGYAAFMGIAGDPAGNIHVSAYRRNVVSPRYYMRNPSGSWSVETATPDLGGGKGTTVAVDPAGRAHVAFLHEATTSLRHAARDAQGGWTTEIIDAPGYQNTVGQSTSMVIDSTGVIHLAASSNPNQGLRYATRFPGDPGFDISTVEAGGRYVSLALDGDLGVHIAHQAGDGLHYVYRADGQQSWMSETVDLGGDTGRYSSLTVDPTGMVHIVYYDAQNQLVKHAYHCP